jgi:hypothetical protein
LLTLPPLPSSPPTWLGIIARYHHGRKWAVHSQVKQKLTRYDEFWMFKNEKQQLRIMGVMFESVHEIVGQYHTGNSTAMSHILSNIKQKHEMSDYVFNV